MKGKSEEVEVKHSTISYNVILKLLHKPWAFLVLSDFQIAVAWLDVSLYFIWHVARGKRFYLPRFCSWITGLYGYVLITCQRIRLQ